MRRRAQRCLTVAALSVGCHGRSLPDTTALEPGDPGQVAALELVAQGPKSPIGMDWPAQVPASPPLAQLQQDGGMDLRDLKDRYTIEVNLNQVGGLDLQRAAWLQEQLAADPRWRVGRWQGAVLAWERHRGEQGWSSGYAGYQGPGPDSPLASRASLVFEDWPAGTEWGDSPAVRRVDHQATQLTLVGWPLGQAAWEGWSSVSLSVNGPAVSLQLHELAPGVTLERMAGHLAVLPPWLSSANSVLERQGGPSDHLLPSDEPSQQTPFVQLAPLGDEWELVGRVNPGAAGWTWLRVLDAQGEPWQEALVSALSVEQVGHSQDPSDSWLLQSRLRLPEGPPPAAQLEIWFADAAGSRLLVSGPLTPSAPAQ